ncbi:host specificity factor TipJ family phage tail protein [Acinetobacter sp. ME22]|uniref:host specificity factor TipJ family phage tail protein n=1 Tax=Acinetobacter sp. ME22 TaxID=2904802 RepID=UPI001EDBB67A|nr:host specificity factor TipJ family phage tail protein [Acinetobacter sp. ME22]MCG2572389.1 host specificity factor TipJ family phage tail protein [Acinetobacter sp. ME22]
MSMFRIFENPLDDSSIRIEHTDNVLHAFLMIKAKYPLARIYKGNPCTENDVTPHDKATAFALLNADPQDQFDVVCHAGAAVLPYIYYAVVAIMAAYSLYTVLTMKKPSGVAQGSSNNDLSSRANKERLGGRVADIFGTVKAIPDLLAVPLSYYNSEGVEIEECLMCLGRGYYQVTEVNDGETAVEGISGSSACFYDPETSLIGTPSYQAGTAFDSLPYTVKKSASINGQTLKAPNDISLSDVGLYFTSGGAIHRSNSSVDFTDSFEVGDGIAIQGAEFGQANASLSGTATVNASGQVIVTSTQNIAGFATYQRLTLTGASITKSSQSYDLSGSFEVSSVAQSVSGSDYIYTIQLSNASTVNYNWSQVDTDYSISAGITLTDSSNSINLDETYTVGAVQEDQITLANASSVNSDWDKLSSDFGGTTQGLSTDSEISLAIVTSKWVGWYYLKFDNPERALFNFNFPQGLYQVTKDGVRKDFRVQLTIEYQYLDINGDEVGEVLSYAFIQWSNIIDSFGKSVYLDLESGHYGIRFRSAKTWAVWSNGNSYETVKLKDVFLLKQSTQDSYPDVTIVRTKTLATDGALSVKERQINCIATRKLYSYATGTQSTEMTASNNFADAVCALTVDPLIGRRSLETLDIESLYATASEINAYFGTAIEFNYTFDDAKMSYEETLAAMASVLFCDARRESNIVYFAFEQPQDVPTLLFNHRNKVPQSEKRTSNFGVNKDYDGIKLTWTDPDDSWSESEINLPNDDVVNPQSIDAKGVTHENQAKLLAYRAYNKLIYQRRAVEFQTYHEADLITRNDLLLVADDTKQQMISSGAVLDQDGLYLELSQRCELEAGQNYVIHLQLPNKSVDVIAVTQGDDEHEVLLARAPTASLILEYDGNLSCTQYIITRDTGARRDLFLVTEKSSDGTITSINYSDLYYNNDKDFINT